MIKKKMDDILLVSNTQNQRDELKPLLMKEFEMTVSDKLEQFLGIGLTYDEALSTIDIVSNGNIWVQ